MNTHDLFDRMASELASAGAVEDPEAPVRTLQVDGTPFARLTDSGAEVFLPAGSPARADALSHDTPEPVGHGWVAVPDSDASLWPTMFEQALHGVRDGSASTD